MKYPWFDAYCMAKPGCVKDRKQEWNADRYMLDGKMFAMAGYNAQGDPIVNLKLEPGYGDDLRNDYPDIAPGYYMNKVHWNAIRLDGAVPDELLKELIDESHEIILRSLSKKRQREITGAQE